jgi:hypothetical protein
VCPALFRDTNKNSFFENMSSITVEEMREPTSRQGLIRQTCQTTQRCFVFMARY